MKTCQIPKFFFSHEMGFTTQREPFSWGVEMDWIARESKRERGISSRSRLIMFIRFLYSFSKFSKSSFFSKKKIESRRHLFCDI